MKLRKCFEIIALVLVTACCLGVFAGCSGENMYKVDFVGQEKSYDGAAKAYRAGDEVTLCYNMIATDTVYTFLLDGESIDCTYTEGKGYVISFVMPEHDVKLECISKNISENVSETEPGTLVFEYYNDNAEGGYYKITLTAGEDAEKLYLDEYTKENADDEEQSKRYSVPCEVLYECMHTVDKNGMEHWASDKEAVSLEGQLIECRFLNSDDELVCVSSEAMVETGESVFAEIKQALQKHIKDENIAQ